MFRKRPPTEPARRDKLLRQEGVIETDYGWDANRSRSVQDLTREVLAKGIASEVSLDGLAAQDASDFLAGVIRVYDRWPGAKSRDMVLKAEPLRWGVQGEHTRRGDKPILLVSTVLNENKPLRSPPLPDIVRKAGWGYITGVHEAVHGVHRRFGPLEQGQWFIQALVRIVANHRDAATPQLHSQVQQVLADEIPGDDEGKAYGAKDHAETVAVACTSELTGKSSKLSRALVWAFDGVFGREKYLSHSAALRPAEDQSARELNRVHVGNGIVGLRTLDMNHRKILSNDELVYARTRGGDLYRVQGNVLLNVTASVATGQEQWSVNFWQMKVAVGDILTNEIDEPMTDKSDPVAEMVIVRPPFDTLQDGEDFPAAGPLVEKIERMLLDVEAGTESLRAAGHHFERSTSKPGAISSFSLPVHRPFVQMEYIFTSGGKYVLGAKGQILSGDGKTQSQRCSHPVVGQPFVVTTADGKEDLGVVETIVSYERRPLDPAVALAELRANSVVVVDRRPGRSAEALSR